MNTKDEDLKIIELRQLQQANADDMSDFWSR